MNCAEWEERVALAAGGDLSDPATDRHLADCPGCQLLLSGLRQTLADLRDAPDEIAPAHYAAVRARVLAEVARPHRRWWLLPILATPALLLLWPLPKVEPLPMRAIAIPPPCRGQEAPRKALLEIRWHRKGGRVKSRK